MKLHFRTLNVSNDTIDTSFHANVQQELHASDCCYIDAFPPPEVSGPYEQSVVDRALDAAHYLVPQYNHDAMPMVLVIRSHDDFVRVLNDCVLYWLKHVYDAQTMSETDGLVIYYNTNPVSLLALRSMLGNAALEM